MKTSQLQKMLNCHRDIKHIFKGVYPCNKLPKFIPPNKTIAIIANTDPAHRPGQHWVAYYFTPSTVFYFDSYGKPPKNKYLKRMMAHRKCKKVFGRRIQGIGNVCGYYCLYFIWALTYGKDLSCFGDDLNANDRLVRKFTRKYFLRI